MSVDIQPDDDWDRSLVHDSTNSIVFPVNSHSRSCSLDGQESGHKKRTLSDLLNLHPEKGANPDEEAKRIADVLGQWINASSSPYEAEDDFFVSHAQDDIALNTSTSFRTVSTDNPGRPRGKSEAINSSTSRSSSVA